MICKKSLTGVLAFAAFVSLSGQQPAKADGGTIAAVAGAFAYHHIHDVHGKWPKSGKFQLVFARPR